MKDTNHQYSQDDTPTSNLTKDFSSSAFIKELGFPLNIVLSAA